MVLQEINVSGPVLAAPSGYNVCLRVGELDVNIDFVPKFDVTGMVEVSFLDVLKSLFLKVRVSYRLQ